MKKVPDHVKAAYEQSSKLGVIFDFKVCPAKIVGTLTVDGKVKSFTMSKTPSDYNAPWRVQRDIRRIVKEMRNE